MLLPCRNLHKKRHGGLSLSYFQIILTIKVVSETHGNLMFKKLLTVALYP